MNHFFAVCIIMLGLINSVYGADNDQFPFASVPKVNADIQVDGIPNEGFWSNAADLGPMGSIDGASLPQFETITKMVALPAGLAIFVDAEYLDKSKLATMHTAYDSQVYVDECIEVFIQPSIGTYRHYIVNPVSARYDELEKDSGWDSNWQAAARTTEQGWSVEMLILWEDFGGKPADGTVWRFNIGRAAKIENVTDLNSWSHVGGIFHNPDRFGFIRIGAKNWVSSIKWSARDTGTDSAQSIVVVGGEANSVAAKITGSAAVNTTVGKEVKLTEISDKEGFRDVVVEIESSEPVARFLYNVKTSPVRELISKIEKRLSKIDLDNDYLNKTTARIKTNLEEISKAAKTADKDTLSDLEKRLIILEVNTSALPPLVTALKNTKQAPLMSYGIEIPLLKILKTDPFEGQAGGAMTLKASRGEVSAAQLALFTYNNSVSGVSLKFTDLKGPNGAIIGADSLNARQVGYVLTKRPVYSVRHIGYWPDPLLNFTTFDMQPDSRELVWVDLKAPRNATPGNYVGNIQVLADGEKTLEIPLNVRIWGFDMPIESHIYTAFGGSGSMGVSNETIWTNMLEHRISPYNCVGGPERVAEASMDFSKYTKIKLEIETEKPCSASVNINAKESFFMNTEFPAGKSEKSFDLDSNALKDVSAWNCTLYSASSAKIKITLSGPGGDRLLTDTTLPAPKLSGRWISDWQSVSGDASLTPDTPAVWDWSKFDANMAKRLPEGLTSFIVSSPYPGGWQEWQKHLSEKGWLNMGYTYLMDEPEPNVYPEVNANLGAVKKAAPGIRNMMTSRGYPEELLYVDIWCPEIYSFDPIGAKMEQERGRTCWWYTAFSTRRPYVNVWTDYPALDCRIWPWMTWKHNLDGMLYWSISYWSLADPWESAMGYVGANGDGSMVYPGKGGEIVDSLRWECLRDGMQDYEVFCLLEAGIRELTEMNVRPALVNRARALCNINPGVLKSYKEFSENPRDLLNERDKMSETLELIVNVLGRNPIIEGRPVVREGLSAQVIDFMESAKIVAADPGIPLDTNVEAKPEPGLLAKYSFDTDMPFAADTSGNALHGIVIDGEIANGVKGCALQLKNNGWVKLPAGVSVLGSNPEAGTVSMWVKPGTEINKLSGDTWEGYSVLFYAMPNNKNGLPDGYFEIGIAEHGPQLLARCGGVEVCTFAAIPTPLRKDQWTHLALTWEKNSRRLYVDGKLAAEAINDFLPPRLDGTPISVGNHQASGRWRFDGSVDEVLIYNRALNEAEIEKLAAK